MLKCPFCCDTSLVRIAGLKCRCLSCLKCFSVPSNDWNKIPLSNPIYPGHTFSDSLGLLLHRRFRFFSLEGLLLIFCIIIIPVFAGIMEINRYFSVWMTGICVLLLGVLITFILIRFQNKQLEKTEKHCPYCGYDIRQSKNICSECGEKI